MTGARAAARWIARRLGGEPTPPKRAGELDFWRREIERYVRWLRGELPALYGIASPLPHEIVAEETELRSAVLTWTRKDARKYLAHLDVPADVFKGMRVLELGCGPIPYALAFSDCAIIGLDPLVALYREAGYPLGAYSERLHYIAAVGEQIPLATGSVDAVVSVNAIDHVDDLARVAGEIDRVVAAGGVILIEAHYHAPRPLEPWAIDDRVMADLFGARGVRKVAERPFADFHPTEPAHEGERLAVWSNRTEHRGR